jgi:hypothetical protein
MTGVENSTRAHGSPSPTSPPPPCKSGLKLVCNVNIVHEAAQPGHVQRFCVILVVGLSLHRSQLFCLCVQLFPS